MRFGNLQTQPWYYRLGLFIGIALAVYAGFWYLVTSGTRAEAQTLNDQVADYLQKNAQSQIASQRLNEFRAAYKSRQEELDELKALLPEQRELTSVLQSVQDRARNSRLTLRRFTPKEDTQQDFYSGKPIEVEVSSTFANLREFFEQMARYQRIVSITDFKIDRVKEDRAQGQTVDAQFQLTAYYVSAEKLQQSAAAQTPTPPRPNPATAPAPAK